jgi:hypothetical protein
VPSLVAAPLPQYIRVIAATLPLICHLFSMYLQLIYRKFAEQLPQNCRYFVATLLQIYCVVAALLLVSSEVSLYTCRQIV